MGAGALLVGGIHRWAQVCSLPQTVPSLSVPSATHPFGFSRVVAMGLWGLAASSAASFVVLIS